jgi:hypothetical protein
VTILLLPLLLVIISWRGFKVLLSLACAMNYRARVVSRVIACRSGNNSFSCSRAFCRKFEMPCTNFEMPCTNFEMPCTNFEMPCTKFEMPCTKFEMPCTNFEMPCTKFEMPCTNFEMPCTKFEMPCTNFEMPCQKFEMPCTKFEMSCREPAKQGERARGGGYRACPLQHHFHAVRVVVEIVAGEGLQDREAGAAV